MKIVIVTGASSGIGKEFVRQMDRYFDHIDEFWLVARRKELLTALAETMRHRARIWDRDITEEGCLTELAAAAAQEKARVCMLVNCAGYGVMGQFAEQKRAEELGMIRLNCEALTAVTHCMLPYMARNGRIIQLASSAAFLPQPDFAVYAATKAYVLSFSRALREELKSRKIYVTAVCPGPVDTPFFEIAEKSGSTLAIKKYTMVTAREVAAQALFDSYHRKALSVCSFPIRAFAVFAKAAPHGLLLQTMRALKTAERIKEHR